MSWINIFPLKIILISHSFYISECNSYLWLVASVSMSYLNTWKVTKKPCPSPLNFDRVQRANTVSSASIGGLYIAHFLWKKSCGWAEEQHRSSKSAVGYLSVGPKAPYQVASDMEADNTFSVHCRFLQLRVINSLLKGSRAKDHPQLSDLEYLNSLALQHFLIEKVWNTEYSQWPGWNKLLIKNPPKRLNYNTFLTSLPKISTEH